MLAYISWHRPARSAERDAYERALEQFHRSLAHRPPYGFRGSAAFRAGALPWLAERPGEGGRGAGASGESVPGDGGRGDGYEDWYLLEDWAALGVLEEAAVARGHASLHRKLAALAGETAGAVYRLLEGHADFERSQLAVWVAPRRGHAEADLAALLGDGMDRDAAGLWRRCLGLGPAPELCLLGTRASAGTAATRLPDGWSAQSLARAAIWSG